jgi:hypothetical protein
MKHDTQGIYQCISKCVPCTVLQDQTMSPFHSTCDPTLWGHRTRLKENKISRWTDQHFWNTMTNFLNTIIHFNFQNIQDDYKHPHSAVTPHANKSAVIADFRHTRAYHGNTRMLDFSASVWNTNSSLDFWITFMQNIIIPKNYFNTTQKFHILILCFTFQSYNTFYAFCNKTHLYFRQYVRILRHQSF